MGEVESVVGGGKCVVEGVVVGGRGEVCGEGWRWVVGG